MNARDSIGLVPLVEAVKHGEAGRTKGENVRLLLEAGAHATAIDTGGQAVIHFAATSYYPQWGLVPIIEAGADVNAQDEIGTTPLLWAMTIDHPETVDTLLRAGADPHLQNKDGQSPCNLTDAGADRQTDLMKEICGTAE